MHSHKSDGKPMLAFEETTPAREAFFAGEQQLERKIGKNG